MICAIVLAAGLSRRMGVQKLLLPFRGAALIAHVVDEVLASAVDQVYVVVGRDREAITEALRPRPVQYAVNARHDSEMLDSVRIGLRALPPECAAVLVVPGDHPRVTAGVIDQLIEFRRNSGRGIAVPCHEGRRGHPLLFSASFRGEILTRFDDTGLRGLLREHADEVAELEVADGGVLCDVDQPEDYRRALARYGGG